MIAVGQTGEASLVVAHADTASAVALSSADTFPAVLATARMVALMEIAAARVLTPMLKDGELSVGVVVNIKHTAATPVGGTAKAVATYLGMEGKLHRFRVEAFDDAGPIGEGDHSRAIVATERLLSGAARRKPAEKLPESAQSVQDVLRAKGIDARVVVLPQSTRTAKEAAVAVGCDVAQIAKSIIFKRADTQLAVLVITSGVNRVDEKRVSAHLGTELLKADAEFVRAATGFVIGGVPPLGHRTPIETLIDESLLALDAVWAAAGTPNALFSIGARDLVAATGGHVMAVAA